MEQHLLAQENASGRVEITDPEEIRRFGLRTSPETMRKIEELEHANAAAVANMPKIPLGYNPGLTLYGQSA